MQPKCQIDFVHTGLYAGGIDNGLLRVVIEDEEKSRKDS
jgi:hypothetical protein